MKRTTLILSALVLGTALFAVATPAKAAPLPGRVVYTAPAANHTGPIGGDWWRTYPYSAYNYGRNPYNPVVVPYVYPTYNYNYYVAPVPVYVPYPVTTYPNTSTFYGNPTNYYR